MTDLTFNQVYAIGAPIVLAMILFEVMISSFNKKSLYKGMQSSPKLQKKKQI